MLAGPRPRDIVYSALKRRIVIDQIEPGQPMTELGLAREPGPATALCARRCCVCGRTG